MKIMNEMQNRPNSGFTLLEVLISLLVIAIGCLSSAIMVLNGVRTSSSSYVRQTMQQYAYDIVDKMRANNNAVINGQYALASGATPTKPSTNCNTSACSSADMATYDLYQFWTDVATLPSGAASVITTNTGSNTSVTVSVSCIELGLAANISNPASAATPTYSQNSTVSMAWQTLL